MKIGIIGSGNVGGNLGCGWSAKGHEVLFGSRNPQSEHIQKLIEDAGSAARAGTLDEALAFGEVIVVALHWDILPQVLPEVEGDWTDKIVIDTTNRFTETSSSKSAAEDIADMLPGAKVVKAFNTIWAESLLQPAFGEQVATMFIAGDDEEAKSAVRHLVQGLGFEAVDAGSLHNAIYLETLTKFLVTLANTTFGRQIAFKLLRR